MCGAVMHHLCAASGGGHAKSSLLVGLGAPNTQFLQGKSLERKWPLWLFLGGGGGGMGDTVRLFTLCVPRIFV